MNDGHFKLFAAAYTEQVGHAGNNPEPLGVGFHYIGPTFIMHIYCFRVSLHNLGPTFINAYIVNMLQAWLIETEGNMGLSYYDQVD